MSWWKRLLGGDDEAPAEDAPDEPAPRSKREQQRLERDAARAEDAPRRRRVWAIQSDVLDMICEAAKSSHPHEFGAGLRAEEGRINEVVLVPGTLGGDRHAILPLHALPLDASVVGTIHSHPGPSAMPSDADLQLFRNYGHTHIIIHQPYTYDTWIAYDQNGDEIELELVDRFGEPFVDAE